MLIPTYHKREGNQETKPAEIDKISSPSTVYLRRNILKVSKETEYGTVDCWQYEEARLTLEEYEEYLKGLKELESPATLQIMKQMSEMQLEQATATLDREEAEQVQMQILSNIELLLESI